MVIAWRCDADVASCAHGAARRTLMNGK